jgi:integrase
MIYKPKGRRRYKVKFRFRGELIHRSTHATTHKAAKAIEAKIRTELEKGDWGILQRKAAPTLEEFFKKDFLTFVKTRSALKPKTLEYYMCGVKGLLRAGLGKLRLDEITDQHAGKYATKCSGLSPSTINCGLKTLRRAVRLAAEWGKIERVPKLRLVNGERQRDRVLTPEERQAYLAVCPQPWKDVAVLMLGAGLRPNEAFTLRWEYVVLNDNGGKLQVLEGKTKAARRTLPMVAEVFQALKTRHRLQGKPTTGWVFPSAAKCGHLTKGTAKRQHATALKRSGVVRFEPYCLRHSALTDLAALGCDAFTLARIAGHSSIRVTERYVHPQSDAIERAFLHASQRREVVTNGGHRDFSEAKA